MRKLGPAIPSWALHSLVNADIAAAQHGGVQQNSRVDQAVSGPCLRKVPHLKPALPENEPPLDVPPGKSGMNGPAR